MGCFKIRENAAVVRQRGLGIQIHKQYPVTEIGVVRAGIPGGCGLPTSAFEVGKTHHHRVFIRASPGTSPKIFLHTQHLVEGGTQAAVGFGIQIRGREATFFLGHVDGVGLRANQFYQLLALVAPRRHLVFCNGLNPPNKIMTIVQIAPQLVEIFLTDGHVDVFPLSKRLLTF